LLLDRVDFFERGGKLGPPKALHLLERFNQGSIVSRASLTQGLELELHLGILEVTDKVCCSFPQLDGGLFGLLRQKLVVKGGHFSIGSHIILLKGLFKVCMLIEQSADSRTEMVY